MRKILIIIEKTKTDYSAHARDLLGCAAIGKTKSLVVKNIYSAIQFHLEGLKMEKRKYLIPVLKVKY